MDAKIIPLFPTATAVPTTPITPAAVGGPIGISQRLAEMRFTPDNSVSLYIEQGPSTHRPDDRRHCNLVVRRFVDRLENNGTWHTREECIRELLQGINRLLEGLRPNLWSEPISTRVSGILSEKSDFVLQYLCEAASSTKYPLGFLFFLHKLGYLATAIELAMALDFKKLEQEPAQPDTVNAAAHALERSNTQAFSSSDFEDIRIREAYRERLSKQPQSIVEILSVLSVYPLGHVNIAKVLIGPVV